MGSKKKVICLVSIFFMALLSGQPLEEGKLSSEVQKLVQQLQSEDKS